MHNDSNGIKPARESRSFANECATIIRKAAEETYKTNQDTQSLLVLKSLQCFPRHPRLSHPGSEMQRQHLKDNLTKLQLNMQR